MSKENRVHERKHLYYYLKVFAEDSYRPIGRMEDISREGMMLFCKNSIVVDMKYNLRIQFPTGADEAVFLPVEAQCVWSRRSEKERGYLTGFRFLSMSDELREAIEQKFQSSCF